MPYKNKCDLQKQNIKYRKEHKEQIKKQQHDWYETKKEHVKAASRRSQLKRKYGLTIKQYNNLLNKQNGVCAICGKPETTIIKGTTSNLSVDHNHITGEIRGLLCIKCNVALGSFMVDKEGINLLLSATQYVINRKNK